MHDIIVNLTRYNTKEKILADSQLSKNNKKQYQAPLLIAFLLLLYGISIAIHNFKVPPIMDYLSSSISLSSKNSSWLMSSFLLVCLVFSIPAGNIVQRLTSKTVMLLSSILVIIGACIGALSSSIGLLLFSRTIEGFGFLLASIAIPVTAIKHTAPHKVGLVMGICSVWISAAQIVAFNTAPYMIQFLSWKGIWWIYILFTVLILVLFLFFFKGNFKQDDTATKTVAIHKLIASFKNKDLLFASFGFFVFNFSLMVMITFFPTFATTNKLMSLNKAGFIASLPMLLSLASAPLWGRGADKFGHKWLYLTAIACSCLGPLMMFVSSTATIVAGAILLGLSGMASPTLIFSSLTRLVMQKDLIAQSNGIIMLFQNAGMFLATFLFSILNNSLNNNYIITATIFLVPLGIIASILIFFTNYAEKDTFSSH